MGSEFALVVNMMLTLQNWGYGVALLILFGLYSLAPVFGLDEFYPEVFRRYGPLSWAMVALMVLGAIWWGVEKVKRSGLKRDPNKRDALRATLKDPRK